MWSKDKLLSVVSVGDAIKVTTGTGLIFSGRLIKIDEDYDTITIQDGMEIQNFCLDDVLAIAKIIEQLKSVESLLSENKEDEPSNIKGNSN